MSNGRGEVSPEVWQLAKLKKFDTMAVSCLLEADFCFACLGWTLHRTVRFLRDAFLATKVLAASALGRHSEAGKQYLLELVQLGLACNICCCCCA